MIQAYQKPLYGNNIGVVFGSFAPLHQGHLDLIMRAKKENDGGCIVIVCGYDGDKGEPLMPHNMRYRYVRDFFSDDDLVAVYAINDTEIGLSRYPNGWDGWLKEFGRIWGMAVEHAAMLKAKNYDGEEVCCLVGPDRTWYVGDKNYRDDLVGIGEECVLVDRTGSNPICATMIRENPVKYWDKIAAPFREVFSHNILITGTASEGKSTLVNDLGKYFNAPHSFEWAKDEYMKNHDISEWELGSAEFLAFLYGQHDINKRMINSSANRGVFFADTDSNVTRMYAEYYAKDKNFALTEEDFGRIAIIADELAHKSRWDKIFLIAPHGIFVDDHSRYMGHSEMKERQELFNILVRNIKNSGDWDKVTVLTGSYYENFMDIVNYTKEIIYNEKI